MRLDLGILSVALVLSGCATHRGEKGSPDSGSASVTGAGGIVSSADSSFAAQACQRGSTEMEIGKLAIHNTSNPAVRRLANKLANDHGKAEKELSRLFVEKGIPQEKFLAPQFQSSLDRLAQFREQDFDRAFKEQVMQDHEKAIALFEQQTEQGSDPQLKAFAQKHLPRLRQHLAEAQQLEIGAASSQSPAPAVVPSLINPPAPGLNTPK